MSNKNIKTFLSTSALPFLLTATTAFAVQVDNNRVRLDMGFEGGETAPELFVPVRWNEHYFSGLGFSSSSSQSHETIEGAPNSRLATINEDKNWRLNVLTWEPQRAGEGWAFGFDLNRAEFKELQFGFLEMPVGSVAPGEYEMLEGKTQLALLMPMITADYTIKSTAFDIRARFDLAPQYDLDLDYALSFKPLVASTGTAHTTRAQDPAFETGVETLFKLNERIHLGVDASYIFFNLQYDVPTLNNSLTGFVSQPVDNDIEITSVALRIVFNKAWGELSPVLGLKHEITDTTDNLASTVATEESDILVIGLENRF